MPTIRHATADDLPELVRLLAQLNDTPAPLNDRHRKAFDDFAADPRQRLLVVENVENEPARNRGIGETLMRYAVEQARAAGCYKVALTSRKSRSDAHRFYERIGFERSSEGFRITLIPD